MNYTDQRDGIARVEHTCTKITTMIAALLREVAMSQRKIKW